MDAEQTSIKLDVSQWRIRLDERSRKRMKLTLKLSKDEALAYKNFAEVCQPGDVSDEDFLKTVFVTGIEALNNQLAEMVRQYASENKEELAASGINVIEDDEGGVRLEDAEAQAAEEAGGAEGCS